ncbi:hypothetical protein PUN28_012409 [Cardiocondyla obscurior]
MMLFSSVVPGLVALLRVWGDMMAMADNMQIGLPFSVTVLKFIIMWFHKKDLEPVISMVIKDWLRTKTTRERDTMIKQARIARITVIFGCIMMVLACIILIIPPCFGYTTRYLTNLTDPGRPMLVQTYFLRDITETPYYELVITAQALSIIMAAISYTGIDTFLSFLVFHICAQLEILKERLLNLNSFKDFNTGLSFNIQDHLRLIRSIDVIDNTFNLMLLTLLVFFAMLFCLQGFLIVNAEGIFYAVYNYAWYLRTPNEAKNLMLIMIRAEKPLYITAGRICPLTLSMFCSLIKTSAGYVSVLLANR